MKFTIAMLTLSATVMMVMIFQAVRQELGLHNLKSRVAENTAEVNRKEEVILQLKNEVNHLKATLESNNLKIDELRKKKTSAEQLTQGFDKSLQTCNSDKANVVMKKTTIEETISQLKAKHEEAKDVAMKEIQSLKQHILDRDRAICAFADMSKKEAQDLCAIVGHVI